MLPGGAPGEVLHRGLLEQGLLRAGVLQQAVEGVGRRELKDVADFRKVPS